MQALDRAKSARQLPAAEAPGRPEPEDRHVAMTKGFVVATNPAQPPAGLEGAVYAIGNFDGVHLGHQAVLARALSLATERAAPSALLTFEPHPADYFADRPVAFRLTSAAMKARICESLGLSGIVFMTFDASLASLTAEEFVAEVLVLRLAAGAVVVGWDFHFGKGRSGTPAFLAEAGPRHGFAVDIVAKVEDGGAGDPGRVVSSTAIRRALERGDVEAAARGLGRFYAVSGSVIQGQRLGRTLGVPTANIAIEPTSRLAHGVYAVRARFDGKIVPGVASFGVRPTVDNGPPLLEVHLLDFSGDLYGRDMEVEFVQRIREERKFDSLASLVDEMRRDIERARAILAITPG
jgi:riboflavin kinase/FMN adenylyltransferase